MDAREFCGWLGDILTGSLFDDEFAIDEVESVVRKIVSFEDAGLLTHDRGVVISLRDGSEFQVTIAQSGSYRRKQVQDF